MFLSPLTQFKIISYGGLGLTNFSVVVLAFIILLYLILSYEIKINLKTSIINKLLINIINGIYNLVKSNLGESNKPYLGVILSITISIFFFNLLGLIPYTFTLTSHLLIALSFSTPVFVSMTLTAIYTQGFSFFSLFLPAGAPVPLIPLLLIIEVISYLARVFSLAIRLGANLIAGHVILKIIGETCAGLANMGLLNTTLSILPISIVAIFYLLEIAVAGLQAYVFAVLTCNYLADSVK